MVICYNDILSIIINNLIYLQGKDYKFDILISIYGTSVIFDEISREDFIRLRQDLTQTGFSHVILRTKKYREKDERK